MANWPIVNGAVVLWLLLWINVGQAAQPCPTVCPDGSRPYFCVCPVMEEEPQHSRPLPQITVPKRSQSGAGGCNASRRPGGGKVVCPPKEVVTPTVETSRLSFEPEMVSIPAGSVQVSHTFTEKTFNIGQISTLNVAAFQIGKYEITQRQWILVMGSNPSKFNTCLDCPVDNVTLSDVQDYLRKLNEKTGKIYRLPTEAEWMHACYGKDRSEQYCGGNDIDVVAWYRGNSGGKTHPVGKKTANGFGLYDMNGNVSEKCQPYSYGSFEVQVAIGGSWRVSKIQNDSNNIDNMCNADTGSTCNQEATDTIGNMCIADNNGNCVQQSSGHDFCASDNGSTCIQYSGFRLAL